MHLITMAHPGEAQGVIDRLNLKRKEQDLYCSSDFILLITGEGPFEAATKTALHISKWNITEITNLGIAGSLNPDLKVGTIIPVRTLYLVQDLKPQFKTFQSFEKGIDCLTTFERILEPKKASQLKGVGEIIDREAWGVAFAAKAAGIPFRAWKMISDIAGTLDACEVVKEKAELFSLELADFFMNASGIKKDRAEMDLEGFYFTFTSSHHFQDLLRKLSIKEEKSEAKILASLPLKDLRELKLSPKERAKRLIAIMEDLIDPTRSNLESMKKKWLKPFEETGIKINIDAQWESPEVHISFQVKNNKELREKTEQLLKFSLDPFHKIMNGDFHVE